MALLIRCAAYLLLDAEGVEQDVDLLLEDNRIAAIGPYLPSPCTAQIVDASGCTVVPGLINTHPHFYQNLTKGIDTGLELAPYCDVILFATVEAIHHGRPLGNERPAYPWSALVAIEMIRAGSTCSSSAAGWEASCRPPIRSRW